MKTLISAIALLGTLACFAAPQSETTISRRSGYGTTTIAVGPSLYIPGAGNALPGAAISIATTATNDYPLYIGVDTGYFFDTGNQFRGYVPVLASMAIEFAQASRVRPVIGIAAGPTFGVGQGQRSAVFGMMFKPGLNISLSEKLSLAVESRIGVLGDAFVFMPQIAAAFAI